MHDKRVIDYRSANGEPLSEAELRAFWLAMPAAVGVLLGGLMWTIMYCLRP